MLRIITAPKIFNYNLPLYVNPIWAGLSGYMIDEHKDKNTYVEGSLELNDFICKDSVNVRFVRLEEDISKEDDFLQGDIAIVDRSLKIKNKSWAVVFWNGEYLIRNIETRGKKFYLKKYSEAVNSIEIEKEDDFYIWGIVTSILRL